MDDDLKRNLSRLVENGGHQWRTPGLCGRMFYAHRTLDSRPRQGSLAPDAEPFVSRGQIHHQRTVDDRIGIAVVMRVEFNQGVPDGCAGWLQKNVGPGNIEEDINGKRTRKSTIDMPEYAWFYERVEVEIPSNDPAHDSNTQYVPTITVKDEKLAIWFALRWTQ